MLCLRLLNHLGVTIYRDGLHIWSNWSVTYWCPLGLLHLPVRTRDVVAVLTRVSLVLERIRVSLSKVIIILLRWLSTANRAYACLYTRCPPNLHSLEIICMLAGSFLVSNYLRSTARNLATQVRVRNLFALCVGILAGLLVLSSVKAWVHVNLWSLQTLIGGPSLG